MVAPMPEHPTLTAEERAELERLRTENAALRAQVREKAATTDTAPIETADRAGRQRWRTIVATLLIVIGCVLAPLSVAAVWTRNQVTNTDRYVATVSPWPTTRPSRAPSPTRSPPRCSTTSTSRA